MQTPTRPFTIGGQTLPQAGQALQTPQIAATPAGSNTKKNVSFRPAVFPSPPSHRVSFRQEPQQQQQAQQEVQRYGQSAAQDASSSVSSAPSTSASSNLPRSTSAPNILPAPSTSRTSPQNRQTMMFGQKQQSSQMVSTNLEQAKQASNQTPEQPISSSRFDVVPVDPKLALEARRATMAKALRVNLVMLLAWYLVTDSRLYSYGAGRLVTAYPQLRSPIIWIIGRLLPALFLYNSIEAFFAVRSSKLPAVSAPTAKIPVPPQAQPVQPAQNGSYRARLPIATGTFKSSPKTRPSTNMLPSPSMPDRRLSTGNTQATPLRLPPNKSSSPGQMFRPENSTSESPTSALRRVLLASSGKTNSVDGQGSPARSVPSSNSMPSGLSGLTGSPNKERASPRVQAYWARNEMTASPLHRSVRTGEDIDRLVGHL